MSDVRMIGRTKMIRTKHTGLDGVTTVYFKEDSTVDSPFTVTCTKFGMHFGGFMSRPIEDQNDLQDFAKFISDCWTEHRKLMTKVATTIAGH